MNSKTELLDSLFNEWERSKPEYQGKFVKDGIIDETLFTKAQPKIHFIAKEPNNPKQEPGDYRDDWKHIASTAYILAYRIAEWSYGLLNNFPPFDNIWKDKGYFVFDSIQSIAFMNIRKSGGSGNSNYSIMMKNLENNLDSIHKQIDIISPNIIITGTTWKELRNKLFGSKLNWVDSGYDIKISKYNKSKVIDFIHPSSRTKPSASYCLLKNIINSPQFEKL